MLLFAATFLAIFSVLVASAAVRYSQKNAVGVPSLCIGAYDTTLMLFCVCAILFLGICVAKLFSTTVSSDVGVYASTIFSQILFSIFVIVFSRKITLKISLGDVFNSIKTGLVFFTASTITVLSCGGSVSCFYQGIFGEVIEKQKAVEMFINIDSVVLKIVAIVSIVVFAPIVEELFFRGLLYPLLKGWISNYLVKKISNFSDIRVTKISTLGAIFIVSAFFSAIHTSVFAAIPIFLMGVLLDCCLEKTNSILAPIVAHSLFNLTNIVIILFASV